MKRVIVQILKPIEGRRVGDYVKIPVDETGVPLDANWRRRLQDAKFDECCKIVKSKRKKRA